MKRLWQQGHRWMDHVSYAIFAFLSFPFFLPLFLRWPTLFTSTQLLLLIPNALVWLGIYMYLIHVIALAFGLSDADTRLMAPLSNDPKDHFGPLFAIAFFSLISFYLYLSLTDKWDTVKMKRHFSFPEPTRKELAASEWARRARRAAIRRWITTFLRYSHWVFPIMYLVLLPIAYDSTPDWSLWNAVGEIFWIALMISFLGVLISEANRQRREMKSKHERGVE